MPIYADLGVPEVWRCDGTTLRVYQLQPDGEYIKTETSPNFPELTPSEIMRLLKLRHQLDQNSWVRTVRQWIRDMPRGETPG